jgi:hypothetical protein
VKLSTRKDIAAPIERIFAILSDFDGHERAALRQGAEIVRLDPGTPPGLGSGWRARFRFRGREREIVSRMTDYEAPHILGFKGESPNFELTLRAQLVALARGHTRVGVELEIRPRSFSGRLLIQTLKLARSRVETRFATRIEALSSALQRRLRQEGQ